MATRGHRKTGDGRPPGTVEPSSRLARGTIDLRDPGRSLGKWWPRAGGGPFLIINCGIIQIGMATHALGVVPGKTEIFLAHMEKLWRYKNHNMPIEVTPPDYRTPETLSVWADRYARMFLDLVTNVPEMQTTNKAIVHYRRLIMAHVNQRIRDCADLDISRDVDDFAKGVCAGWDKSDLCPRYPSLRHATLVSLVLALEPNDSAELIEMGSFIEMRVPLITREIALSVYQQACRMLARLCPEWWMGGYTTEMKNTGDIDRLFRAQYARMINDALVRGVEMHSVSNSHIQRFVNDDGELLPPDASMGMAGVEVEVEAEDHELSAENP